MAENMIFKLPGDISIPVDPTDIPMIPCRNETINWNGIEYIVTDIKHVYENGNFVHVIINLIK